jgi:hypothetical protein
VGKFTRSLALTKASWNVLVAEQEMLGFTLLGAAFTLVAVGVLAVPGVLLELANRGAGAGGVFGRSPLGWLFLFLFYLVTSFVTLYFNTALVGAALLRLRGGQASFAQGMATARANTSRIFVYAVITATVGLVLALIEERFRFIGQIVGGLLGAAWGVVTFLVIPVMVAEGVDPLDAIKRSGQLLAKTWGEQIIGSGGISLVAFLFALLAVIPAALGFLSGSAAGTIAGIAVAVLYLAIVFLVASALGGIYRTAVYLYAVDGTVPAQFDGWMLRDAFRPRKGNAATLEG